MNAHAPIPSLRPSARQELRRLISSYRHNSRRVPWDAMFWTGLDGRAYRAADRLDRAAEIRWCRRMSESRPVEGEDDWFGRGEMKRREAINHSIYHGGQ